MTVKNTAGASRRLWIASALALACGSAWPQNAPAPNSDQPIRLVVGYAAGGPVDAVARHEVEGAVQGFGCAHRHQGRAHDLGHGEGRR